MTTAFRVQPNNLRVSYPSQKMIVLPGLLLVKIFGHGSIFVNGLSNLYTNRFNDGQEQSTLELVATMQSNGSAQSKIDRGVTQVTPAARHGVQSAKLVQHFARINEVSEKWVSKNVLDLR